MKFLKSSRRSKSETKPDQKLIEEFKQSGDDTVIEILFDRYGHLLFAVCMNYLHSEAESKDAVIDIFSKILKDLRKYEIKNFGSWIHKVTKNYCFHELGKRKNHFQIIDVEMMAEEKAEEVTEVDETETFLLAHLEEAIGSLNDEQKQCVELFYLGQKSYEEIERMTGYSFKQVKSYIQNGKRNLKIYLSSKQHGKQ